MLYVDDMLMTCKNMLKGEGLKEQLSKSFDMKDVGDAKKILGMEIVSDRSNGYLYLSQKRFIEKVLKRFSLDSAKVVFTPLSSHFFFKNHYPQTNQEEEDMRGITYINVVESIMYAMVCS